MNAIILAAGLSSRFAPLSYEKPKGLLRVKGEILIERQIRQLMEANITDITVVVGYKAEMFGYLAEKYAVHLVMNEDYQRYNNISSIIRVTDRLDDTYICCSDNYFPQNVFLKKPTCSYYSALFAEGNTNEYCLTVDSNDMITGVSIGGTDSWYMVGHVFFNHEFSAAFKTILENEYIQEDVRHGYWEDVYIRHLDLLKMKINKYNPEEIEEFDSIDDLRKFDSSYEELYQRLNKDQALNTLLTLQHTANIFPQGELTQAVIERIGGMSNKNFRVTYLDKKYVLRIPGNGAEGMVDRSQEEYNANLAASLKISPAQYFFDSQTGIKVTAYLEGAEVMDCKRILHKENLDQIVSIYKTLHCSGKQMANQFSIFREIEKYEALIKMSCGVMYDGWQKYQPQILNLEHRLNEIGHDLCPCHNDAVPENFIKSSDGSMYLIDWEYSGMNAPMADLAALFLECEFSKDNQNYFLRKYFEGYVPVKVYEKIAIFQILWDYLWAQWTVIKEAKGDDFGTYGRNRYNRAIENLSRLLKCYEQ